MRTLATSTAAAVFFSTLAPGMAQSQAVIEGAFDDPDFVPCASLSCGAAPFYHATYQITVSDPAQFSLLIETQSNQNKAVVFAPPTFDPTSTGAIDLTYFTQWLPPLGTTNTYTGLVPPEGEYTLILIYEDLSVPGLGYILTMNGVFLGWGPSPEEILDEVEALFGETVRNTLSTTFRTVNDAARSSIATRDAVLATHLSTSGAASTGLPNDVYTWARLSNVYAENEVAGRTFRSPMVQIGADVALNSDLIVGVSLGYGDIDATASGGTGISVEGTQVLLQPYMAWTRGDWEGTAALTFGRIDYETITTSTGTAGAQADLLAVSASVQRSFAVGDDGMTLTPFAEVNIGQVELTETSGSLAGTGVARSVDFSLATIGTMVSVATDIGQFSLSLAAEHYDSSAPSVLHTGTYDATGWSGSVGIDLSSDLGNGWDLNTTLEVGGLGTDTARYSGGLEVAYRF